MNLVDCYVTKVLSSEEEDFGDGPVLVVRVEYDSYGNKAETDLLFKGEDRFAKAAEVARGYSFLA